MVEKKRVYTERDLLHKLEMGIKDFCNLSEINVSLLNKYL
jgi:hypothetical protein